VGVFVGTIDGSSVATFVGALVGALVGKFVGLVVGDIVGTMVGALDGADVANSIVTSARPGTVPIFKELTLMISDLPSAVKLDNVYTALTLILATKSDGAYPTPVFLVATRT
jgi:uncharacterized protein YqgC (DUF456 family)